MDISSKRGGRDRLSELPDSLILLILSSLGMADAVATTFLSRRWRDLWTAIPCLNFWYKPPDLDKCQNFIYAALLRLRGPEILKFSITFSDNLPPADDLDSWLHFAIGKKVEELSVHLPKLGRIMSSEYCPPQCLYSCSSITKLSLSFFKLKIGGNVRWDRLKSLTIIGQNSLSAAAMNRVLCGAPQLEELVLFVSKIVEKFSIQSTSLKTLCINRQDGGYAIFQVCKNAVLRICAPNLSKLMIATQCNGSISLDVPSLTSFVIELECGNGGGLESLEFSSVEMYNQVYESIRHVKDVTLSRWFVKFLLYLKLKKDVLVEFPNAKSLHLISNEPADELLDVLEMFPKLVILNAKLDYLPEESFSLSSATTASLNHLKTVEITWSVRRHSIFRVIQVLLENAHVLEKMVLRFFMLGVKSDRIFDLAQEKVLKMRRSSPTAKVIIMTLR